MLQATAPHAYLQYPLHHCVKALLDKAPAGDVVQEVLVVATCCCVGVRGCQHHVVAAVQVSILSLCDGGGDSGGGSAGEVGNASMWDVCLDVWILYEHATL